MARRVCLFVAILALLPLPVRAAETYLDLLKENFMTGVVMNGDPRIPDEIEGGVVVCLAEAFVKANIPAEDLAKLDQAVVDGTIEMDPLAGHYAMLASDRNALLLMSMEAEQICPEILKAYHAAKNG